jgi:SAM-dependent methyltransferase
VSGARTDGGRGAQEVHFQSPDQQIRPLHRVTKITRPKARHRGRSDRVCARVIMTVLMNEDDRRALSFGVDAEQYDRARPSYPEALVEDLAEASPTDVLDVGCGTGKAGALFRERGCRVLGVEPDARMADLARRRGLEVEVATFEGWDPAGGRFDLVVSGQAWHWVDPAIGVVKLAEVLRPGGRVGLFWNWGRADEAVRPSLDAVYVRIAPALSEHSSGPGSSRAGSDQDPSRLESLQASGLFDRLERRVYEWDRRYSRAEWLDLLPTTSDHRVLPPAQLASLLEALAGCIDDLGGSIEVRYQTSLLTAVRR